MSTHNICFGGEIRRTLCEYPFLSGLLGYGGTKWKGCYIIHRHEFLFCLECLHSKLSTIFRSSTTFCDSVSMDLQDSLCPVIPICIFPGTGKKLVFNGIQLIICIQSTISKRKELRQQKHNRLMLSILSIYFSSHFEIYIISQKIGFSWHEISNPVFWRKQQQQQKKHQFVIYWRCHGVGGTYCF